MTKALVQSIPTYSMSVFRLPIGLLKDIEAMIQKFWWGCSENSRKIHWVRWETLCSSKSVGGMGFKDLRMFNDAMLGSKFGVCFMIGILWSIRYFELNIFSSTISLMLKNLLDVPMLGRVFCKPGKGGFKGCSLAGGQWERHIYLAASLAFIYW